MDVRPVWMCEASWDYKSSMFFNVQCAADKSKSYGFRLLRAGRTPCHPASTSAPPILNAQQQRGRFQLGERLLQCISPATVPACRETPVLFSLMFSLSYTLDFPGLFAGRNTCSTSLNEFSACRTIKSSTIDATWCTAALGFHLGLVWFRKILSAHASRKKNLACMKH